MEKDYISKELREAYNELDDIQERQAKKHLLGYLKIKGITDISVNNSEAVNAMIRWLKTDESEYRILHNK